MNKEELIKYIEKGLDDTDKSRIWILLKNSNIKGVQIFSQIDEWKRKLINKEHIEGTPWNIPKKEKAVLAKQFANLCNTGSMFGTDKQ